MALVAVTDHGQPLTRKPVDQNILSGKAVPPRGFYRDRHDARRYQRLSLSYLLAVYGVLGFTLAEWAPVWILFVLVPPLYVRCALSTHELMHISPANEVSLLHRLMMVLETPVCLGYREHRDIHIRHHRYPATERDPEFFQIRGGHLRALLSAMLSPEWSMMAYLREKRGSRAWLMEAAVRCGGFFAAWWLNPAVFLWYWITIRLSAGMSAYTFHHLLHYRRGGYGTFPLRPPRAIDRIVRIVLGTECVQILYEHPAHHAWQQVKAQHLPAIGVDTPRGREPIALVAW